MSWRMGPQNLKFKRLQPDDFRSLKVERIQTYVETGTFWGYQLRFAAEVFPQVIGIELDPQCVERSREWCQDYPNVTVMQGDSRELLPQVIEDHPEPTFFYLDAHWCYGPVDDVGKQLQKLEEGPSPLWDELGLVRDRDNSDDIVFVDDCHAFGVEPGWERISVEAITRFMDARAWMVLKDGLVMWQ